MRLLTQISPKKLNKMRPLTQINPKKLNKMRLLTQMLSKALLQMEIWGLKANWSAQMQLLTKTRPLKYSPPKEALYK